MHSPSSLHDSAPFVLSDRVVDVVAGLRPITATFWGVAGHDGAWDDFSPAGHARVREVFMALAAEAGALGSYDDPWLQLAVDVLVDFLRLELDRYAHGDHLTDMNPLSSPLQMMVMAFDVMDGSSERAWRDRICRLEGLPAAIDGYRATLSLGLETGHVVAARQVHATLGQARVHASDSSFLRAFPAALAAVDPQDATLPARLDAAIPGAQAAFAGLAEWLEAVYLPRARPADAVGRDRYVREARRFLGAELDPEETYAWGWGEIAAISAPMRSLAAELAADKTVAEVLAMLEHDPARRPESPAAFLAMMTDRQASALSQLAGTHFDVPDAIRTLDVKFAPPGGHIGVYYMPPSEDLTRPGCVWYSPGPEGMFAVYDQIATAYHEGFPGHHLQIGTQVALTERLSRLHRVSEGYSGYAEGWALYSEQLMGELGYYELPEYRFGMLACQMLRACRIVIDIGAHLALKTPNGQAFHPGEPWSFELGVQMLVTMGGLPRDRAEAEMTRYLGWPGQAISYKVGHRVIAELRAQEQQRLGAAFDLKAFHSKVLGRGAIGLDHLRRLVAE